jgi:acyl carrier protein
VYGTGAGKKRKALLAQHNREGCLMNTVEELISELKVKIIQTLGLLDVTPADIKDGDQLVGGDTGIDSIDVLELVMMIEKDYGVKIENKELGAKVFASVRALATYIFETKKRQRS